MNFTIVLIGHMFCHKLSSNGSTDTFNHREPRATSQRQHSDSDAIPMLHFENYSYDWWASPVATFGGH